jgi:NADPH:quinone reductase-like Zn-dependent oxidoreductase
MNMKAFAITARDSQPALQDLPQPQPAAGEVLVEVEAASVNGFDLSVAAGYVWDMLPHEFPVVLGRDLVGTVTAAGDGVDNVEARDRVAGVIPGVALGPRNGSFAEQVSLPASAVTRVPSRVGAHAAAVIGLAGIAAHDALEALDVQRGETVLISGATGGVGSIALQLAVAAGATVIATARPGQEEEYVRGLGAAHTVDYTGDVAAAVEAIAPYGADKALHAAGDAAAIGKVMRAGGGVASTLAATAQQLGRDDVTVTAIMAAATAGKLARLLDHVASENLRVNIEARVPLDRAHEALKTFADGTLGKVLITR